MLTWILCGIFLLLAILLLSGKGAFLLAGYNTANEEEKQAYEQKYNVKKVCRSMGAMLLAIAILLALTPFFSPERYAAVYINAVWIIILGGILFAAFCCKKKKK